MITQCSLCRINTAGQHEPDCPMNPDKWQKEVTNIIPSEQKITVNIEFDKDKQIQQLEKDLKEANEKLANIKYLNEKEVERILEFYHNFHFPQVDETMMNEEQAITAILALAIPEVDKERLEKFLFSTENVDNENLIGEALIDEKKLEALSNFSIISKLSEQVITEDRIVEVLNIHMNFIDEKTSKYEETNQNLFKRIAHEILEGQGWEVVVSGEVRVERFNNIRKTLANVKIGNIYFRDIEEKLADECQGKNIEVAVREVG